MAIAYVRDTGKVSGVAVGSITLTFSTAPSVGSSIGVQFSDWDGGTPDVPSGSVTDNKGNSYAQAVQAPANNGAIAGIHWCKNVATSGGTFTVTLDPNPTGSGHYIEGIAIEFSGMDTASGADKTATNSGTSTTPTSGTTAATTQADELVLVAVQVSDVSNNVSLDVPATTGYTNLAVNQDSGNTIALSADYKIIAATGAQSAAWGTLAGSMAWSACIATFKAASGGGGPSITYPQLEHAVGRGSFRGMGLGAR